MDIKLIKRLEHICLKSDLDLKAFGRKFEQLFALPNMEYDYENETEWLTIDKDKINYNISRPYEIGTLQEWDDTTPEECNFGIVLSFHKDHSSVNENYLVDKIVANICEQISNTFETVVYHHRTFTFGIDRSERKNIVFKHKSI